MANEGKTTAYLPAGRVDDATIKEQGEAFGRRSLLDQILESIPMGLVILNRQRQIVFANAAFQELVPAGIDAIGIRVGEALNCVHAGVGADG